MIRDRGEAIKRVGGIKAIYAHLLAYAQTALQKGTPVVDAHWFLLEESSRFVGLEVECLSNQISDKCFHIAGVFAAGIVFTDTEREKALKRRKQQIEIKVGMVRQLIDSGVVVSTLEPYIQKLSERTIRRHFSPEEWKQYLGLKDRTKSARIQEVKQARKNGMSVTEISKIYELARQTVYTYLEK